MAGTQKCRSMRNYRRLSRTWTRELWGKSIRDRPSHSCTRPVSTQRRLTESSPSNSTTERTSMKCVLGSILASLTVKHVSNKCSGKNREEDCIDRSESINLTKRRWRHKESRMGIERKDSELSQSCMHWGLVIRQWTRVRKSTSNMKQALKSTSHTKLRCWVQ